MDQWTCEYTTEASVYWRQGLFWGFMSGFRGAIELNVDLNCEKIFTCNNTSRVSTHDRIGSACAMEAPLFGHYAFELFVKEEASPTCVTS